MKDFWKKLKYIIVHQYNPYPMFWYDLFTERHIKNRIGECVDCSECCRFLCGCYCVHVDRDRWRCKIYDDRKCHVWFPVSQKEIERRESIQPGFKCKFRFDVSCGNCTKKNTMDCPPSEHYYSKSNLPYFKHRP